MAMVAHERSLVKRLSGKPFVLLGIDEDDDRGDAQEVAADKHLTWRSWWDKEHKIASRWNVEGLPTLFLIDHKGAIRKRYDGVPDQAELERAIDKLLAERASVVEKSS